MNATILKVKVFSLYSNDLSKKMFQKIEVPEQGNYSDVILAQAMIDKEGFISVTVI